MSQISLLPSDVAAPLAERVPASGGMAAIPWSRLALTLLRLAGATFSCVLLALGVKLGPLYGGFVVTNQLASAERNVVAGSALGAALVVAAGGFVAALMQRRRHFASVEVFSVLVAPLSLAFVLPALFNWLIWQQRQLAYLSLLTVVVLASEQLCRAALAVLPARVLPRSWQLSARWRRWLPIGVLLLASSAFAAWGAYYTLFGMRRGFPAAYDLGIYDNLMYNALHGQPFHSPVLFGPAGGNYIAGHAEFAMLFFLPIYALYQGAETLLVLQAVLIGFAALPLYFFAKTQLPRWLAFLVALSFLLYAPLHGPVFYDFHWISVGSLFHFTFYYALATRRRWLIWSVFVFLLLLREDVAVGTTVVGLFLVLAGEQALLGASIAALSALWFVIDKFVIMPWAGEWWFAEMYKDLMAPGERGYSSVIKTLLINPVYVLQTLLKQDKLTYFAHLFAPLAYLPARRPVLLMLACPGAFFTLLTTGYSPTLSISFQYTTHWIPYLFAAAILGLRVLGKHPGDGGLRQKAAALALLLGVSSHSYVFGGILQQHTLFGGFERVAFKMTEEERNDDAALRRIIRHIPRHASVAATDREVPRVSARKTCYVLTGAHGKAQYLLVSRKALPFANTKAVFMDALRQRSYGLVDQDGPFYLFKANHQSDRTEQAFDELGVKPRGREK